MEALDNKNRLYIAKQKNVRLFGSNLIELLSTCHHLIPFIIFIPVSLVFYAYTVFYIYNGSIDNYWLLIPLCVGAILLWTFIEYTGHRYIFHKQTSSKFEERLLYVIHWAHHDYPDDTKRLVVPLIVTIPAGFLLYYLSYLIFGLYYAAPFFAVLLSSYIVYDWCHYACHHLNFKNKYFQLIKKHHLLHHYKDPDNGYGFTTTLWDKLLNTMFKS